MSKIKVRLVKHGVINLKLKPQNGVKVKEDTTYLYDPTLVAGFVDLAEDWAIKTDGQVEEEGVGVDYSSKAWAIGGTGTETNNSKYYAEQAAISETNASNSATTAGNAATTATTQAGIATNKANAAATSESNALSYSQNAATSASNASSSATNAHTSETNAASSASTATTQAGVATTQASLAGGSASAASASATSAATSSTNAQIWAEGSDVQVAALGGEKSSKGWAARAKELVDSIGSVLHYKGSVATFDDLPTTGQELGDMYNITSDGTNVVWDGSDWDDISGVVDLSPYRTASDQDTIDANFVTKNTAQDITATKTFKAQQKFQSGDAAGCLTIGADVSATTVSSNTRKLGRMCFYTNEDPGLKCSFVSTDSQDVGGNVINFVEFGGRSGDQLNTSPDTIQFTVANSHNSTTSKTTIAEYTASGSQFNSNNLAVITVNRTSNSGGSFTKYARKGTSLGHLGIAGTGVPAFSDASAVNNNVLVRCGSTTAPAVGSATQPVYIDSNGIAQECSNSIPTDTSDLTNGAGFLTSSDVVAYTSAEVETLWGSL